jgi:hypothetical protein
MPTFPQLTTGAVAQFPFRAEVRFRSTRHEGPNGDTISYVDPELEERAWDIALEGLTDGEWAGVEALFEESRGKLGGFTFLDPTANLLAWSEAIDQEAWMVSGVGVTLGAADPLGGNRAATLTAGGGGGTLLQTIAAPAAYRYVGSVWARTVGAGAGLRVAEGQAAEAFEAFRQDGVWRRYEARYSGAGLGESVKFEVVVPTGTSVDVFGPQLEAQTAASEYKRSGERSGVHPNARFDQDVLTDRATGANQHGTRLRIVWTPSPA